MKWIIYMLLVAVSLWLPAKRLDVGKLRPIEAISVWSDKGELVIQTDTGDYGTGSNIKEAIADLRESTPGIVYLDTAEYLLLGNGCEEASEEIRKVLKPDIQVCRMDGIVDPSQATGYLAAKRDKIKEGTSAYVLWEEKERIKIKSEKNERDP